MNVAIYAGDCIESLKKLEDESINTCITSPPYWGLRNYNDEEKQLGMEATPEEFVENLVKVFREVKRVLRDDGTVWLNLGDSYKKSNLTGIPWLVALALQKDGWYLRQDIIWHKPNPMPESVKNRCTKAHEYIFLLSKSPKYYYDNEAIKEDAKFPNGPNSPHKIKAVDNVYSANLQKIGANPKRNKRSVWTITTKPFKGAHFATFPKDLIEPCVLAGCPEGGTVLDTFAGSGTTAEVANAHNRNTVLCELSNDYIEIAKKRLDGMFANINVIGEGA
tara:strand:+ start:68 stop:898 length:831 start_codon:yes stop_codon:yes gene_type:complete